MNKKIVRILKIISGAFVVWVIIGIVLRVTPLLDFIGGGAIFLLFILALALYVNYPFR